MPDKDYIAFYLLGNHPIENNDTPPMLLKKNKPNPCSGWRLDQAQRDFIISLHEINQEKK